MLAILEIININYTIKFNTFNYKNKFFSKKISKNFVNLPKKKINFTVIKSPHIYKSSRDQFSLIFYKKCVFFNLKSTKILNKVLNNLLSFILLTHNYKLINAFLNNKSHLRL